MVKLATNVRVVVLRMHFVVGVAGLVTSRESAEASQVVNENNPGRSKSVHHVEENSKELSEDSDENFDLYSMTSSSKPKPYRVDITINDKSTKMEIDTGASLSLVSEHTFREYWPELDVSPSQIVLHSYSGESIPVLGTVDVVVNYNDHTATLPLLVVKGEGPSLLGRNWLSVLKLNWHEIFWLHNASLKKYLTNTKLYLSLAWVK